MITITTATGKTFESDYAVAPSSAPLAFIRIVNSDIETVERVFSDENEFPLVEYPQLRFVADFIDEYTGIKLVLKK